MRAFIASLEPQENEQGDRWQVGTRTIDVTIPNVEIASLDWPEAVVLASFAFGTPNPIAAEYEFEPDPEEE
jgi:hypothetical protein